MGSKFWPGKLATRNNGGGDGGGGETDGREDLPSKNEKKIGNRHPNSKEKYRGGAGELCTVLGMCCQCQDH